MRSVKLLAALAASACLFGQSTTALASSSAADEMSSASKDVVTRPVAWTTCKMFFYAPSTSGDPHAGEVSIDMWSEPFKPAGPLYYRMYYGYSSFPVLTGELYNEYAAFLSQHIDRTLEYFQNGECAFFDTPEKARAFAQDELRKTSRQKMVVPPPSEEMLARAIKKATILSGEPAPKAVADEANDPGAAEKPKTDKSAPVETAPTAAEIAAEKHRAVEERNRAAQEKYEAELAKQKRKVEEYERVKQEVARKKTEQQAAAQAALAEHDAKRAASDELLRQYDAAQRRHNTCLAGDQQACADIAAGKPAMASQLTDAGKASTDTDANQCVTTPETRLNDTTQGNTAAYVVNGCGQPVDVQVCLMTTKGWNCGATYGLASQQRWSHSSFNATGQVFSDARTSGSSRPLAKPN